MTNLPDCVREITSPDVYVRVARVPLVSPYAFRWIRINDPSIPESGSLERATYRSDPPKLCTTSNIHEGNIAVPRNAPMGKWNHVSIEVDDEFSYPASDPPIPSCDLSLFGMRSSILKARAYLNMNIRALRFFDFDIGAGVEFDVAAYGVAHIELLVPDPRLAVPSEPAPIGFDQGPLQLISKFTSSVYFTHCDPQGYAQPLTYTVPFVLGPGAELFVPRVPGAQSIQAVVDGTLGGAGSVAVDFLYVPGDFNEASYTAPPTYFLLGTIAIPAGSTLSAEIKIPGNANAFRIRRTNGDPLVVGSLIQILNV